MFTTGFASDVLGSAALSQPAPLGRGITLTEHVVVANPVAWNWVFAVAELLIGVGMVLGRDGRIARVACMGSIGWGLGVWVVGEGLGGLLTGHAALGTGAPGAALLYVLLTVAAWPRHADDRGEVPLPRCLLTAAWVLLWLIGAVLDALPAQWGARGLSAQAAMGWMMSPSWAAGPALGVARWFGTLPVGGAVLATLVVVALQAAVGLGVLRRGVPAGMAVLGGAVLSAVFWVFGQGFGGVSTGTATDVGTAPLVVLLAAAVRAGRAQCPAPAGGPPKAQSSRSEADAGSGGRADSGALLSLSGAR